MATEFVVTFFVIPVAKRHHEQLLELSLELFLCFRTSLPSPPRGIIHHSRIIDYPIFRNSRARTSLITTCFCNSLRLSTTAGLVIDCRLGLCSYFCCGGLLSNPRPVLDSSAQTTRRTCVLSFFEKSKMSSFGRF